MSDSEYKIPNDPDVTPADIEPSADLSEADLFGANLTEAYLSEADLSEADLFGANLTEAYLGSANLTEAYLRSANLSEANLNSANLTEANLNSANLTEANLHSANLTEANLHSANLSEAYLGSANLSDIKLNQGTQLGGFCGQPASSDSYDRLAQSYHDLKSEFSDHGLDGKARQARYLERRARTREALAGDTWSDRDIVTGISGFLSRILTGYGTRVSHVLAWTAVLLILPALWYAVAPISKLTGGPVYYSVVTFVTSPPNPPVVTSGRLLGILTEAIVLFQTYTGTALIILFGYVLSNRDRI